jgi:hypothetical protein
MISFKELKCSSKSYKVAVPQRAKVAVLQRAKVAVLQRAKVVVLQRAKDAVLQRAKVAQYGRGEKTRGRKFLPGEESLKDQRFCGAQLSRS